MSNNDQRPTLEGIAALADDLQHIYQVKHDEAIEQIVRYLLDKYFHNGLSPEAMEEFRHRITRDFDNHCALQAYLNRNNWINTSFSFWFKKLSFLFEMSF